MRDENVVESALARAQQRHFYAPESDIASLAAADAFGLATTPGYVDGNKRTAFVDAVTFLDVNGFDLHRTNEEAVETMIAVASGGMTENDLAAWFRIALRPFPPDDASAEQVTPFG